eukprot:8484334-Alexandrium_andersonii.AAC.1
MQMMMMMMMTATTTVGTGMANVSVMTNARDVAMATESETIGMEGATIAAEESVTTSTHHANFMRAEVIHTKIVSSALVAITSRRTGQSSSTNLARLLS